MGSGDKLQEKFDEIYEKATDAFRDEEFDDVERYIVEARKVALEMGGSGRRNLAACLNLLSAVCASTERADKAADLAVQAFQILAEEAGEPDEDLLGVAGNAGKFLIQCGRIEEGAKMFDRARALATSQGQTMDAALTYLHQAQAMYIADQPKATVIGLLDQCLEAVREDTHGDPLYEAAGAGAALLYELDEKDKAVSVLTQAMELQDKIYRLPIPEDLTKNPAWVLDFSLARSIVFRENYQNEGVDPIPMNELRLLLADMLMDLGKIDDAIQHYERLDQQLRLEEQRANEDEEEEEDDEAFEEDDDAEDEGDIADDDDGDEDDDDLEDDDDFSVLDGMEQNDHYVDRARFYAHYAAALHLKGREEGIGGLLRRAAELYEVAEQYADPDGDPEFMAELAENMREVQQDLKSF